MAGRKHLASVTTLRGQIGYMHFLTPLLLLPSKIDIKSSVLFLPRTGLPTNVERSSDIITTVQQAFHDGHLASTLVICLPAILVTSTMTRPMNVLQELPVTDFHESLIGECRELH